MDADICIILNAKAGKRDTAVRERIQAATARHPGRFDLHVIGKNADFMAEIDRIARAGYRTIVAAGGDGTISAVAAAAHRHDRVLGVLPMGTFNFFARGLDLPEEVEAGIDLLAAGPTRTVSLGAVNGRIFLNNASLGIYPAILAQREGTYRRWGRSRVAAHWSVVVTFFRFHRPLTMRVMIDGRVVRKKTPLAFVARSDFQLEQFQLDGVEDVRAGRHALFLAPDSSRFGLFQFAMRLAWRSMRRGRDFDYYTGDVIDIETSHRRRLVARDGERERMDSPFHFEVLKDALTVIAPERA